MYWGKRKDKSFYVIRGIGMVNYLIRQGFDLIKAEDDKDKPEFKVFLFKNTPELREAMGGYKKSN